MSIAIREKNPGDHANIKFSVSGSSGIGSLVASCLSHSHTSITFTKGEGIEVFAGGGIFMFGCIHAFQKSNNCRSTLCVVCYKTLMEENLPESRGRGDRRYKFPGCKNHCFWDMNADTDNKGAYWCTEAHKKANPKDPRPRGCVHCKRPFVFCGNKRRK